MDKKRSFSVPAVGITSLLVIVAALCLAVFSVLALSTVQADVRLSRQTRETVLGYYRAELEANELLARLRSGEIPREVTEEDGVFSFRCAVSSTQALEVEVEEESYKILRWQTVSTVDWQTDEKLPVWDGQG